MNARMWIVAVAVLSAGAALADAGKTRSGSAGRSASAQAVATGLTNRVWIAPTNRLGQPIPAAAWQRYVALTNTTRGLLAEYAKLQRLNDAELRRQLALQGKSAIQIDTILTGAHGGPYADRLAVIRQRIATATKEIDRLADYYNFPAWPGQRCASYLVPQR